MGGNGNAALGFALFIIIIALIVTVVILLFPGETTEDKEIREMQEKIDNKILDAANKIKMSTERDAEQADEIMKVMEKGLKTIDETEERVTVELTKEVEAEYQNFIKSTLSDEEIEWLDFIEDTAIPDVIKSMEHTLGLCESMVSHKTYFIFTQVLRENKEELDALFDGYLLMQETLNDEIYMEYGNIKELSLEYEEIVADLSHCLLEKSAKYK